MSFAKNLRTKRKKLGLSAEELAKRVHVSRSYITLLESGKRSPGKTLLSRIARALKKVISLLLYLLHYKRSLQAPLIKETSWAQEPFDLGVK